MNKFLTVLSFHLKEALRGKAFIITAVILFLSILGFFGFTHFFGKEEKISVKVLNESTEYAFDLVKLKQSAGFADFKEIKPEEVKKIKAEVEDGKIDALIILSDENEAPEVEYFFKRMADFQLLATINSEIQPQYINKVVTDKQIDSSVASALLTPVVVKEIPLKKTESLGLVYFFLFLMYMFIILYGQMVSMGIAGEKTSRVMEIMITKVQPITMMYAKIISSMLSGLIQIGMVALAYGMARVLGWTSADQVLMGMPLDLSVLNPKIFVFLSIYFVLGFIVYALLFASISSVINRMEDIGSIIFPISLLLMGAFMLGMKTMLDPNAGIVLVGAYIPFFSPMVVFSRIVLGEASVIEITLSIVILIASIGLLSVIANRIYTNGVMRYSGKTNLADVVKMAKTTNL